MGELVRQHLVANPVADEDEQRKRLAAADILMDKQLAKQNLLRFYAVTEAKVDDSESKERWIIRCDKTAGGQRLKSSLLFLDSEDVLARVFMANVRGDRAPKGAMIRNIENILENYLGRKGGKGGKGSGRSGGA